MRTLEIIFVNTHDCYGNQYVQISFTKYCIEFTSSIFAKCFGCITQILKIYKGRYLKKYLVFDLDTTCTQSLLYLHSIDIRECIGHKKQCKKQEFLITIFVRILSKLICIASKNNIDNNTSCCIFLSVYKILALFYWLFCFYLFHICPSLILSSI